MIISLFIYFARSFKPFILPHLKNNIYFLNGFLYFISALLFLIKNFSNTLSPSTYIPNWYLMKLSKFYADLCRWKKTIKHKLPLVCVAKAVGSMAALISTGSVQNATEICKLPLRIQSISIEFPHPSSQVRTKTKKIM